MKVIGGGFPREVMDRDDHDDAWMEFGGGGERFTSVLDKNLISHMIEMIRVFVYMWILRRLSRIRRKCIASFIILLIGESNNFVRMVKYSRITDPYYDCLERSCRAFVVTRNSGANTGDEMPSRWVLTHGESVKGAENLNV